MPGLTEKQQRFVGEYLIMLNATQAAISAGYSPKTAKQQGSRLLTNVDVQRSIQKGRDAMQKRLEVSLDAVVAELIRVAFTGMSRFVVINEVGEPVIHLADCSEAEIDLLAEVHIEEIILIKEERRTQRVRIKVLDRLKALELLGNFLGSSNNETRRYRKT